MATFVEPSYGRGIVTDILSKKDLNAFGEWIVPSGTELLANEAANASAAITGGPQAGFEYDDSLSSGLTATFATGEAFVGGRYLLSDDISQTDNITGNPIHEVSLPANDNTTVYLGPDIRNDPNATDRLIIGRQDSGQDDFGALDDPAAIPLADIVTGSSSILEVTDRRQLTPEIDVRSSGASTADALSGIPPADWARTDTLESFEQSVSFGDCYGTPGSGDGEILRVGGAYSDWVLAAGTGKGRIAMSYNAVIKNGSWQVIRGGGGDNCSILTMNHGEPGIGSGALILTGSFVTSSSTTDGETIADGDWEWVGHDGTESYVNGEQGTAVTIRPDAPSASAISAGTGISWIDTDGGILKYTYESGGTPLTKAPGYPSVEDKSNHPDLTERQSIDDAVLYTIGTDLYLAFENQLFELSKTDVTSSESGF